jgi:hypothetical protein
LIRGGFNFNQDPYHSELSRSMWFNIGYQQIHVPVQSPSQIIGGALGIVVPDLESVMNSLTLVEPKLENTKFSWKKHDQTTLLVTDPAGSAIRVHQYDPSTMYVRGGLGVSYIQIHCPPHSLSMIHQFYTKYFRAESILTDDQLKIIAGPGQHIIFEESEQFIFDGGYHICVYINDFEHAYHRFEKDGLLYHEHSNSDGAKTIQEARANFQFRINDITSTDGSVLMCLEHEVRSMYHPSFMRPLMNRSVHYH